MKQAAVTPIPPSRLLRLLDGLGHHRQSRHGILLCVWCTRFSVPGATVFLEPFRTNTFYFVPWHSNCSRLSRVSAGTLDPIEVWAADPVRTEIASCRVA